MRRYYAIFEGVSGQTVVQEFFFKADRDDSVREHLSSHNGIYYAGAITRRQFEKELVMAQS